MAFIICLWPCRIRFEICCLSSFWLIYILYWFANCCAKIIKEYKKTNSSIQGRRDQIYEDHNWELKEPLPIETWILFWNLICSVSIIDSQIVIYLFLCEERNCATTELYFVLFVEIDLLINHLCLLVVLFLYRWFL